MKTGTFGILDIGEHKIVCIIAHADDDGSLRVLGAGQNESMGIVQGHVMSLDHAETAIRRAVSRAENMANVRLQSVLVNISARPMISNVNIITKNLHGQKVKDQHINEILKYAQHTHGNTDMVTLHCTPLDYAVDNAEGTNDPRGLHGKELKVKIHTVHVPTNPLINLNTVIERCHLAVDTHVATPIATSLACLDDDEKQIGVLSIDIGAGSTSIAVYRNGYSEFVDQIPLGGKHITNDLRHVLMSTTECAEMLKIKKGHCIPSASDQHDMVTVQLAGEDEHNNTMETSRARLIEIIQPRMEEIYEHVAASLANGNVNLNTIKRAVLTGGGSEIAGACALGEKCLPIAFRQGKPKKIPNLPNNLERTQYATAIGLVLYATRKTLDNVELDTTPPETGWFGRWFQKLF
jgi:cell division protein FtsA